MIMDGKKKRIILLTQKKNGVIWIMLQHGDEHEGDIVLIATDELIDLTNKIRKEQGNTDLVGIEYDNEVYYNFYLMFNTEKKSISIRAVCNYGEKDDEVYYELLMTDEEKENLKWRLINMLATEIYNS